LARDDGAGRGDSGNYAHHLHVVDSAPEHWWLDDTMGIHPTVTTYKKSCLRNPQIFFFGTRPNLE